MEKPGQHIPDGENKSAGDGIGEPGMDNSSSGNHNITFAVAASFALLVISLSLIFYSFNLSSRINRQQQQIEMLETRLSDLKEKISQQEVVLSMIRSRSTYIIRLKGMSVNPGGHGAVIRDTVRNSLALHTSNLPPVSGDSVYQLWSIRNNQPSSLGTFHIQPAAVDTFIMFRDLTGRNKLEADTYTVTLETGGVQDKPSGKIYLVGKKTVQ